MIRTLQRSFAVFTLLVAQAAGAAQAPTLAEVIAAPHRTPEFAVRDVWRHPLETLRFFDVKPSDTVVEIWPGGAGWYTEILAPYLRERGRYVAAIQPVSLPQTDDYARRGAERFRAKLASNPAVYDRTEVAEFRPPERAETVPPGSADVVLTFRNVHNWIEGGYEAAAFEAFYTMLKPGGTLGVVEHRAAPGTSREQSIKSGYVTEAYIRALAYSAGFKLAATSPINNNPNDTKDYPEGVWTLPPVLRLKEVDRDKYLAIGESDRMTFKFVKPKR
ncbi:MAG: methyltransferase [Xanthomonadaceae bacterium]|nr:methyltransferase [Xanthomonadaceae bacterium]